MSSSDGLPPGSQGTPAGWYADTSNGDQQRYWDGSGWTDHYAPSPASAPLTTPIQNPPPIVEPKPEPIQTPSDADWYTDPHVAGQLRYWDGTGWTNDTAPAEGPAADAASPAQASGLSLAKQDAYAAPLLGIPAYAVSAAPPHKKNLKPLWITVAAVGAVFVALIVLGAVVGGKQKTVAAGAMPTVTGQRLDVAQSDLKAVGVDKTDVEVVGGGTFGVVNESAWTVCSQQPAPGSPISKVRLIVDRTCTSSQSPTQAAPPAISETPAPTAPAPEAAPPAPAPTVAAPAPAPTVAAPAPKPPKTKVKVPNGVGMNYQAAQDIWRAAGLIVYPATDATGAHRLPMIDSGWVVLTQDLRPGKKVPVGTFITATVKKYTDN